MFEELELEHYGTPRHSGRYPWGSGENPYQHSADFLAYIQEIKKASPGITDKEIAEVMGISTTVLRARRSAASDQIRAAKYAEYVRLHDKGVSTSEIARRFGVNESSVRAGLKAAATRRADATQNTINVLKDAVSEKKFIDIGPGSELYLGISDTRLKTAVNDLKEKEGYQVYNLKVDQLGTGFKTTVKVLCPPGTEYMDLVRERDKISFIGGEKYTNDNGQTYLGIKDPTSVNPDRVKVIYKEDGGAERDGTILLRPGVADISLGEARYAQVRIKVGEDRYLKGMAMYGDPKDFPDGVDLMFNTNKTRTEAPTMADALKETKADQDNPFGATVRQRTYIDENGEEKLSAINIVGSLAKPNEEGNWGGWNKTISSQVLSKQPVTVAKKQLDKAYKEQKAEYDEIMALTNPTVRKHLLEKFADGCDAAATHLDAAGLPRQQWHVILPFPDIPDNEVYAPNYENGENVVLIRYPHAGRFEIASLTVNNNLPSPKASIPNAKDAVGINNNVAKLLSGADFDGDTVLVIPNNSGALKVAKPLEGLKDFDPGDYYPAYEGMPKVGPKTGFNKQKEMGMVSNLITDMTIQGAPSEDIAAAVRHSMVVIDAEKHNLNWRQSAVDNNIALLREKYQGKATGGAATIVSKAGSPTYVPHRRKRTGIDPDTGEKVFYESGETYVDKKGKVVERKTQVSKMSVARDAYELTSDPSNPLPMERVYANYANQMKALGNQARKSYLETPSQKYSPAAAETYKEERESLVTKLKNALKNSPRERQAQIAANMVVAAKRRANPEMDNEQLSRLKAQALSAARAKNGAIKDRIKITSKEWEAIQAGAITNNQLKQILQNTDIDIIRSYATPRSSSALSAGAVSRARSMLNSGKYTQAEVASLLGVSVSTLSNALNA